MAEENSNFQKSEAEPECSVVHEFLEEIVAISVPMEMVGVYTILQRASLFKETIWQIFLGE